MTKRRDILILGGTTLIAGTASAEDARRMDFESGQVGALPAGVTTALTGSGGPVKWAIVEDASAPAGPKVLAQTSKDTTDYRFPLAIFDEPTLADLDVAVRFKPVSGEVDRAAGIAVRLADRQQLLRRARQCARGQCPPLPGRGGQAPPIRRRQHQGADRRLAGAAAALAATASRSSSTARACYSATDTTFTAAGRVALWTKADSVTYFDDLRHPDPCRRPHAVPSRSALLPPVDPERHHAAPDRKPLREQLRRRPAPPERGHAELEALDPATDAGRDHQPAEARRGVPLNSTLLHELYFASLGGDGRAVPDAMAEALTRDFGSVDRWRRAVHGARRGLAGGSGWVLLTWLPRDGG